MFSSWKPLISKALTGALGSQLGRDRHLAVKTYAMLPPTVMEGKCLATRPSQLVFRRTPSPHLACQGWGGWYEEGCLEHLLFPSCVP